jgi:hypothetical protein
MMFRPTWEDSPRNCNENTHLNPLLESGLPRTPWLIAARQSNTTSKNKVSVSRRQRTEEYLKLEQGFANTPLLGLGLLPFTLFWAGLVSCFSVW